MKSDDVVEPVRLKVRKKLLDILDDSELTEHVEICIYNHTIRRARFLGMPRYWKNPNFRYAYTTKALSIIFNLKNPRNPKLLERLMKGEIGPKKLVNGHPAELFPEPWDKWYDEAAERTLRKQRGVNPDDVPDGVHQCRQCKSMKTTYTQLQTRSADEPMTTFVVCLNCSKRWKF